MNHLQSLLFFRQSSVIKLTGVLYLTDIFEENVVKGITSSETSILFQRPNLWTMNYWTDDDSEYLAIMENNSNVCLERRGYNTEEPISTFALV